RRRSGRAIRTLSWGGTVKVAARISAVGRASTRPRLPKARASWPAECHGGLCDLKQERGSFHSIERCSNVAASCLSMIPRVEPEGTLFRNRCTLSASCSVPLRRVHHDPVSYCPPDERSPACPVRR